MTQPFLILHKVRGEPAFDIAINIGSEEDGDMWIIPTSGHRAYPYHYWALDDLYDGSDMDMPQPMHVWESTEPPANCPDHYEVRAEAVTKLTGLLDKLGLKKSRPPLTLRPL